LVPALIESIKVAGLVLAADTSEETFPTLIAGPRSYSMPDKLDGILRGNGVLRFNDTVDM
jgi:CDK inhibitor PHO81